jgi:hypothetical protein
LLDFTFRKKSKIRNANTNNDTKTTVINSFSKLKKLKKKAAKSTINKIDMI